VAENSSIAKPLKVGIGRGHRDAAGLCGGIDDGVGHCEPVGEKAPLHTLPYDELLAKLKSLTNHRAVPDSGSDTGWKIEIGPFPGWGDVPEWNP